MKTRLGLTMLVLIVAMPAVTAFAQHVYVPGKATGCFGSWDAGCKPLVTALTVSGAGTITVRANGKVDGTGPNGRKACWLTYQKPLQEAKGITDACINNWYALLGVFVPQSWVQRDGFQPVDATKNLVLVSVKPGGLFFVGEHKKFQVKEAGTLFLGINDEVARDNSGGFHVNVAFTAP